MRFDPRKPLQSFQRTHAGKSPVHVSFARSLVGRTLSRTGVLLRRQLWIFPIAALIGFFLIDSAVRKSIESTMRSNLQSQLQTLLNAEKAMLETWFHHQESNAQTQASDPEIRDLVEKLLELSETNTPDSGAANMTTAQNNLRKVLAPALTSHNYVGYSVIDRSGRVIAADQQMLIGQTLRSEEFDPVFERVLSGETLVTVPFASQTPVRDSRGVLKSGQPTMYAITPVRDSNHQVIAIMGLRIRPEREFTRILQLGQIGSTGETFAFDRNGTLVSNSRFDEELILLGILPDRDDSQSILNVALRNPGGDMTQGYRLTKRRSELPLIHLVEKAVQGESGVDVSGEPDYRGVPTVSAWTWLPKYNIGIGTKQDAAEAFRPLIILQQMFWVLIGLLAVAAIAIFVFSLVLAHMRREAQKEALHSKRLGQYTLEEKLGSGGMGVVYKGRHAVLRRPTAIKMLDIDKVSPTAVERFEREVQMTCQLNHPNTVAIYDFGRTDEGIFYYAMEFIEGIDLQVLIDKYGPQSEARVIHILQQVCGSLYEAHSLGLVHRDIKPANIMLCRRGGEPDFSKVLDFGLVKAMNEKQQSATASNSLTGTPLYLSPEAIQASETVDPRSDLYALGAVGYFLLTGKPVFQADSLVELCQAHVSKTPVTPSARLNRPVSPVLEGALMSCLEKSPSKRPQTARDLANLLSRCPSAREWSVDEAEYWWGRHNRGESGQSGTTHNSAMAQTYVQISDPDSE